MKIRLLFTSALAICIGLMLTSNSNGRADGANQGNTGAPGDNARTCVNCHNNSDIEVELNIVLIDGNGTEVTEYIPDQTYTVKVSIDSTDGPAALGWGFQMVCLDAELDVDGEDLENWVDSGNNNYKIAEARERQYVEHAGVSSSSTFEVEWTAPSESTGTVSFYAAGNGVNFNGGTSGDGAAVNKLEITEGVNTSTDQLWAQSISVSPNPAVDQAQLTWNDDFQGQISLLNITGQQLTTWTVENEANSKLIDVKSLQSGLYLIQFTNVDGSSKTMRIIKK